jgi:hypothetical protein
LTFALWELAKCRNVQKRLRAEIMETLGRINTRGDKDFTVNDFDSMPYLLAFGKVLPEPRAYLPTTVDHPPFTGNIKNLSGSD